VQFLVDNTWLLVQFQTLIKSKSISYQAKATDLTNPTWQLQKCQGRFKMDLLMKRTTRICVLRLSVVSVNVSNLKCPMQHETSTKIIKAYHLKVKQMVDPKVTVFRWVPIWNRWWWRSTTQRQANNPNANLTLGLRLIIILFKCKDN
jgi:hypothetical protein